MFGTLAGGPGAGYPRVCKGAGVGNPQVAGGGGHHWAGAVQSGAGVDAETYA